MLTKKQIEEKAEAMLDSIAEKSGLSREEGNSTAVINFMVQYYEDQISLRDYIALGKYFHFPLSAKLTRKSKKKYKKNKKEEQING